MSTDAVAQRAAPAPAGLADVIRSEWLKFRTVRSTYWSLLIALALGIGLSALISLAASTHYKDMSVSDRLTWDPTSVSTSGFAIAQLALAVLGVLVITSEFSTGSIMTTLAAVPRRHRMLVSKALVLGVVAVVVGEIGTFVAFAIGQAIIHANAPSVGLGDSDVLRALIGPGLYVAALAIAAMAIGAIVKSTAAAVASIVALLYVLPIIGSFLPDSIHQPLLKFWPTQAGGQIASVHREDHTLPPWLGLGWMWLFTLVLVAIALSLLQTRDV